MAYHQGQLGNRQADQREQHQGRQAEREEDAETPFAHGGAEILDENVGEELDGSPARGERGADDVHERRQQVATGDEREEG